MSPSHVGGTRSLASFGAPGAVAPARGAIAGDHVGEVIASSTTELVAQARRLHGAPDFGAFVRVESAASAIVGAVFNARTESIDPNRRPTAYGKSEAELRREQPQIFELLRTQFEVFVLGYIDAGTVVHRFPPQPARIHSFVFACAGTEVLALTEGDLFLRSILSAPGVPADELILACLRQALAARAAGAGGDKEASAYLVRMGSQLARLLRDDYERLSCLVRRLADRGPR